MKKKIKVILSKSFEFDPSDFKGNLDELTEQAVVRAKRQFYKQFETRSAKPLMQDQVIIQQF